MKHMLRRSIVGISVIYRWLFIRGPNVCFFERVYATSHIHFLRSMQSPFFFFSTFLPLSFLQLHIQTTTSLKVSPPTSNPESLHWFIIDISLADGWHQTTEGIASRKFEQEEENKGDFFIFKCEVWYEWTSWRRPSSLSLWWEVRISFSGDVLTDS